MLEVQLFQSQFIAVISPGASRFVSMQWTLLNSGVSLCGCEYWLAAITATAAIQAPDRPPASASLASDDAVSSADYAAAYTIDKKWMGRKRLQAMGAFRVGATPMRHAVVSVILKMLAAAMFQGS